MASGSPLFSPRHHSAAELVQHTPGDGSVSSEPAKRRPQYGGVTGCNQKKTNLGFIPVQPPSHKRRNLYRPAEQEEEAGEEEEEEEDKDERKNLMVPTNSPLPKATSRSSSSTTTKKLQKQIPMSHKIEEEASVLSGRTFLPALRPADQYQLKKNQNQNKTNKQMKKEKTLKKKKQVNP